MKTLFLTILNVLLITSSMSSAHAEKADRDKPVQLEADKVTVDDKQQLHVYEGNVVLTQGTLTIKANRLNVKQDADGYQRGIALGGADSRNGLAWFRQKREGKDDYVEGEGERIEHDNRSEKTEFFTRAHLKSGLDEVSGQYIIFDSKTENYVVSSSPGGVAKAGVPAAASQRVIAIIQPKNKEAAPTTVAPAPTSSTAPLLRNSSTLSIPRETR